MRAQAIEHDESRTGPTLPLRRCKAAEEHLRDWSQGLSSAPRVARHMAAMLADGRSEPMVHRMGRIGGMQPGVINDHNCHAGLMSLMTTCGVSELVTSIVNPDSVIAVIKPTSLLTFIFQKSPTAFELRLGANSDKCFRFWEGIYASTAGRELFDLHPALMGKTPADLRHAVPLFLHEDAGPYSKRRSANCVSYSSILGIGREKDTKMLFSSEVKFSKEDGFVQDRASWDIFFSEFDRLAAGVDEHGTPYFPIRDGSYWSFIMIFGKGDMEVICQVWGLNGYGDRDEICGWCLCNRSDLPYTDCRTCSNWRHTTDLPNDIFVNRVRVRSTHPLVQSRYFNKYFIRLDGLHIWDYRGIASIVSASVVHLLSRTEDRLGANVGARLTQINDLLVSHYRRNPVPNRVPRLKDANLLDAQGWASLHGKVIKAANTRNLHTFLVELADEYFDKAPPHPRAIEHASIRKVCKSMSTFYNTMYSGGMFLTREEKATLTDCVNRLGRHTQLLRTISESRNERHWYMPPKTHYGQHFPEQADLMNPRFSTTYSDESFIGVLTKIWAGSCNGPFQNNQQRVVLLKALVLLILTLDL